MIYDKASLVQIPSGYKSGTLYSVVPNTADGDFTVTGDPQGEATRVNKDGLIESVAADVPRLNYDFTNPQDPHLLLEPTRTQLAEYTNDISSANGYGLTNGTLTTDSHTAPDGSNEASTFEATSAGGQFQKVKIGSSGVQYTVSAYVKRKTGTGTVYLRAVENTNTAITVTDEWARVSLTVTSTSVNIRYGMALATSGDEIYVWGFQVEAGSYATSLIPNTSSGEITRTQDRCIQGGDSDLFNDSEGVLFAELEALAEGTTTRKICLTNGTTDFVNFNFNTTSGRVDFEFGSTSNSFYIVNSTGHTLTNKNKIAIKYKSGDTDCYINGTRVTGGNGTFTLSGLDRINFENRNTSGSQAMFAKIYQLMYFNTALTDAELQTLTS